MNIAIDPTPLIAIWELPPTRRALQCEDIEAAYLDGRLPVYGFRHGATVPERVPPDFYIDWRGPLTPEIKGPCASNSRDLLLFRLFVSRADWERLLGPKPAEAFNSDPKASLRRECRSHDRKASDDAIHKTITKVYDNSEVDGTPPPNVKKIGDPVQALLAKAGLKASKNRIMSLAAAPQHAARRRPVGPTIKNEQRVRQQSSK